MKYIRIDIKIQESVLLRNPDSEENGRLRIKDKAKTTKTEKVRLAFHNLLYEIVLFLLYNDGKSDI